MKIKKLLSAVPAACLLLTAVSVTSAGAVDAKNVTSGAVVEVYSGDKLNSSNQYGSAAEAWGNAAASANDSTETIITLGSDWSEDELLTVGSWKHITLDLNGHFIRRKRNHEMTSDGAVFKVEKNAVFTLRDSNPRIMGYDGVRGGVITGGASSNSGGVHIEENGHFRMEGGTIYDCITDADGGAFHVNDDNIALSSCEITGNSADGIGGGVYVDPRYNVTLRGKMIIKDNTSGKGAGVANLALDKSTLGKARIINAGLSKGSDVHFGSTASGDIQVSEWMSEYQMQYFTADEGRKFRNESRTVDASVVVSASIFSEGGLYAVILLGGVGVIATVLVIIFYRKKAKKGGEDNA